MKIDSVDVVDFDSLPLGEAFIAAMSGKPQLCLKASEQLDPQKVGCVVVLAPSSAGQAGKPYLMERSPVRAGLRLVDAEIAPVLGEAQSSSDPMLGDLLLQGKDAYLLVEDRQRARAVHLATGQIGEPSTMTARLIFKHWRVVTRFQGVPFVLFDSSRPADGLTFEAL